MNERLNWMFPSFYGGNVFSTDIRVSWWFALVPLITCPRHGMEIGLAFTGLLLLAVLIHEMAHVIVARWTGGSADEIHLTPIGGVTLTKPGQGPMAIAVTAFAGPFVNLVVCAIVFPGWYAPETLWKSLNPFVMPISQFDGTQVWKGVALLFFLANWITFLVNMLPVMPLDGGQMLRALLSTRIHPELVHRTTLHIGLGIAILLLIVGVSVDMSQVVLVGCFVLVVNVLQLSQEELGEAIDDTGYGYEFSTEFESLESSNSTATQQTAPGLLQRWRNHRRLRREQQERIRRMEAEQKLDSLLAKVHEKGLQSLSDEEKTLLRCCSELLRTRPKSEE